MLTPNTKCPLTVVAGDAADGEIEILLDDLPGSDCGHSWRIRVVVHEWYLHRWLIRRVEVVLGDQCQCRGFNTRNLYTPHR